MGCEGRNCRNDCCESKYQYWKVPNNKKNYKYVNDECCDSSIPPSFSSLSSDICKDVSSGCEDIHRTCSVSCASESTSDDCERKKKKINAAGKRKRRKPCDSEPQRLDSETLKCRKCRKKRCSCKKKRKYIINLRSKRDHPWECDIEGRNAEVWSVNGSKGGTIHFKRGRTYHLYINQDKGEDLGLAEFYFSIGPMGSRSCILPGVRTCKGVVKITIDDEYPSKFFYQSSSGLCRGGIVQVHD